jgi:rRNA pseudouridine-1189 N-methylase Emg1 (Nep1/Mra1 family)
MMTEREMELAERINKILGVPSEYMTFIDIMEKLVEVIENVRVSD